MLNHLVLYFALFTLLCLSSNVLAQDRDKNSIDSESKTTTLQTPNPAISHNNRAVELACKGFWKEAIKEHEAALKEDPSNRIFKRNLSAACLRYGNSLREDAIKQYKRALEVDPDNKDAAEKLKELVNAQKK
jgi:tetratricopeptide (TPR) repeat protein